jgi:hypothetical protein
MNAERVSAEASAKADMLRRVSPKNVKMPRLSSCGASFVPQAVLDSLAVSETSLLIR